MGLLYHREGDLIYFLHCVIVFLEVYSNYLRYGWESRCKRVLVGMDIFCIFKVTVDLQNFLTKLLSALRRRTFVRRFFYFQKTDKNDIMVPCQ